MLLNPALYAVYIDILIGRDTGTAVAQISFRISGLLSPTLRLQSTLRPGVGSALDTVLAPVDTVWDGALWKDLVEWVREVGVWPIALCVAVLWEVGQLFEVLALVPDDAEWRVWRARVVMEGPVRWVV